MTIETCEKQRLNCLAHNDAAGAKIYADRIARKKAKLGIVEEVAKDPVEEDFVSEKSKYKGKK